MKIFLLECPILFLQLTLEWSKYFKQKDLVEIIGFKSRVSEIMNNQRKLTLEMIRNLNAKLHIPTEILIQEY